jgi:hypothetical protein
MTRQFIKSRAATVEEISLCNLTDCFDNPRPLYSSASSNAASLIHL